MIGLAPVILFCRSWPRRRDILPSGRPIGARRRKNRAWAWRRPRAGGVSTQEATCTARFRLLFATVTCRLHRPGTKPPPTTPSKEEDGGEAGHDGGVVGSSPTALTKQNQELTTSAKPKSFPENRAWEAAGKSAVNAPRLRRCGSAPRCLLPSAPSARN